MDNLNTQSIMKAGLAGAGVNIIVALLGFGTLFLPASVAIAGSLIACCGWALIPVGTGALYGYFTPGRETIGQAALGGAVSGIVAGLVYGIFNALLQGGYAAWQSADIATTLTASAATLIGGCCGAFIVGGILGAIGGAIWTAVQGDK